MTTPILCIDCSAKETKKNKGVRYDGGGCYSIPIPEQSRCLRCKMAANGFKYCLGCAIETPCCQGCDKPFPYKYGDALKAQVADARTKLESALAGALSAYEEAIATFRPDAEGYERFCRQSEQQFNADVQPLVEAEEAARVEYNASLSSRSDSKIAQSSKDLSGAQRQSEEGGAAAYDRHMKRVEEAAANFPNYKQYRKAVHTRDSAKRKASHIFSAEVKRAYGLWKVEQSYESDLRLADLVGSY